LNIGIADSNYRRFGTGGSTRQTRVHGALIRIGCVSQRLKSQILLKRDVNASLYRKAPDDLSLFKDERKT
jgi:hypothetical protein